MTDGLALGGAVSDLFLTAIPVGRSHGVTGWLAANRRCPPLCLALIDIAIVSHGLEWPTEKPSPSPSAGSDGRAR